MFDTVENDLVSHILGLPNLYETVPDTDMQEVWGYVPTSQEIPLQSTMITLNSVIYITIITWDAGLGRDKLNDFITKIIRELRYLEFEIFDVTLDLPGSSKTYTAHHNQETNLGDRREIGCTLNLRFTTHKKQ